MIELIGWFSMMLYFRAKTESFMYRKNMRMSKFHFCRIIYIPKHTPYVTMLQIVPDIGEAERCHNDPRHINYLHWLSRLWKVFQTTSNHGPVGLIIMYLENIRFENGLSVIDYLKR